MNTDKQTVTGEGNALRRSELWNQVKLAPQVLAEEFVRRLSNCLTVGEMEKIRRRNATPEYGEGVCASHDFIDANMVMSDAFEKVIGREIDCEDGVDCALWSKAWDIAKRDHLTAKR